MSDMIYLSKKHGLAPALGACWICGRDNGEVVLLGKAADKIEYKEYGFNRVASSACKECGEALRERHTLFRYIHDGMITVRGVRKDAVRPSGSRMWLPPWPEP